MFPHAELTFNCVEDCKNHLLAHSCIIFVQCVSKATQPCINGCNGFGYGHANSLNPAGQGRSTWFKTGLRWVQNL